MATGLELQGELRSLVLSVAFTGFFSFLVCLVALGFAAWVSFGYSGSAGRAPNGFLPRAARLCKSTSGLLLLNVILANFLQGLGFTLNIHWLVVYEVDDTESSAQLCWAQAALVQIGGVAACLASFAIAVRSFAVLFLRVRLSFSITICIWVFSWIIAAFLALFSTVAGPKFVQTPENGNFYSFAEGWCWISDFYGVYRVWLHYIFVIVLSFMTLVLYAVGFYFSSRPKKGAPSKGKDPEKGEPEQAKEGEKPKEGGTAEGDKPETSKAAEERAKADKVKATEQAKAKDPPATKANDDGAMAIKLILLCPILFLVMTMPIMICHLAKLKGKEWEPRQPLIFGTILACGGLVNTTLFVLMVFLMPPVSSAATVQLGLPKPAAPKEDGAKVSEPAKGTTRKDSLREELKGFIANPPAGRKVCIYAVYVDDN